MLWRHLRRTNPLLRGMACLLFMLCGSAVIETASLASAIEAGVSTNANKATSGETARSRASIDAFAGAGINPPREVRTHETHPHTGVQVKTKMCMKCRIMIDPLGIAMNQMEASRAALRKMAEENLKKRTADELEEKQKQERRKEIGDPAYATDTQDAKRLALDKEEEQCLQLPGDDRKACLAKVKPKDGASGGFFIETGGGGRAGNGGTARDAVATAFRASDPTDTGTMPELPASETLPRLQVLRETTLCANEGSREFMISLFKGYAGKDSYVECVDIEA